MQTGVAIADVNVVACSKGYAHVVLQATPVEAAEPLPVFLRYVQGRWELLGFGPELQCERFADLPRQVLQACDALGLL